ncbi:MAG: hypothetical protein IKQ04_03395 [Oscillospiraceae bacterium]|nr:hypothetical protein [Oscillospiraceae bacterium]
MSKLIELSLAGLRFSCRLRYEQTAAFFPPPDPAARPVEGGALCLSEEDWNAYLADGMIPCANTEFSLLSAACSDALMACDRMILHAVALRWGDRAWLIAAPSGVGKSTQAKTLRALRPGTFGVICGDRPVLEFRPPASPAHPSVAAVIDRHTLVGGGVPDAPRPAPAYPAAAVIDRHTPASSDRPQTSSILVHPSPWNGKENWHGAASAPLGGVILLQRGEENDLRPLRPREAAVRLYTQVIQNCADPDKMRKAAELIDRLLNSVPLWQLSTNRVPDSTLLLLDRVFI